MITFKEIDFLFVGGRNVDNCVCSYEYPKQFAVMYNGKFIGAVYFDRTGKRFFAPISRIASIRFKLNEKQYQTIRNIK